MNHIGYNRISFLVLATLFLFLLLSPTLQAQWTEEGNIEVSNLASYFRMVPDDEGGVWVVYNQHPFLTRITCSSDSN